jgi:hypothetical protein
MCGKSFKFQALYLNGWFIKTVNIDSLTQKKIGAQEIAACPT